MPDVKDMWDLLWDIHEKTKGTSWETIFPAVVIAAVIILVIRFIIIPLVKQLIKLYKYIKTNWFIKKKFYEGLSFMESKEVYYAIDNFVPTRFSTVDPSNDDEPAPEYTISDNDKKGREKEPLLIERFLKYEYSIKEGKKYYLCLGDCGMGKTTFLINLYYETLKLHKYKCVFISLQEENCISRIEKIEDQANTILLLDALDENDSAVANYPEFSNKLERATRNFYRVIITARTNFFENEINEKLTNNRNSGSVSSKLSSSSKFYITPFTDEDIKKYLKTKYHFSRRKINQAWSVIEENKNLSVRPLLLKFMDEIIVDNRKFSYDFELYEFLFGKWIERERRNIDDRLGKDLYDECLNLAKQIYYNWMENGSIGIYPEDTEESSMPGIKAIKLKGHAMLNRTSDGMYKFSHKSYWEFLLAKLALSDIKFADELYIKNFDRAYEFICEMIDRNNLSRENTDRETTICEATYMLKYESLSRAERKYRTVADSSEYGSWMHIVAMTKLAESMYRQQKEASAKEAIYEAYEAINHLEFDREHLHEFSEFARVFSLVSRTYRIIDGQNYLERLIAYYRQYHIVNYDLLRCYNEYCRCCLNYKLKQEAVNELEEIINLNFENDQYAQYILLAAKSWKMSYKDRNLNNMLGKAIKQYSRFMDIYDLIINNCDMAVAVFAYYSEHSTVSIAENPAYSYFEDAYSLCAEIYEYDEEKPLKPGQVIYEVEASDILNNPYMVIIQKKLFQAFSYIDTIKLSEIAKPIFKYINANGLNDEMVITRIGLYKMMGRDYNEEFEVCEEYLQKELKLAAAISNTYYIADSCKRLYWLYDDYNKHEEAIVYLKDAYAVIDENGDLRYTPEYCSIIMFMMEDANEGNDLMAKQLFETARMVFGSDKRKKSIYSLLRDYYADSDNKCMIEIDTELLKCDFENDNLERLFESCTKYGDKDSFGLILNSIIIDNGSLSETEYQLVKRFLEQRENELNANVMEYLKATISKFSRGVRRKKVENSYADEEVYDYADKEISYRNRYVHSVGVMRLTPYIKSVIDKEAEDEKKRKEELIDIQEELERKFKELFGSLDDSLEDEDE